MIGVKKENITIELNEGELKEKIQSLNLRTYSGGCDMGNLKIYFKRPKYRNDSFEDGIEFILSYNMESVRGVKCNDFVFHNFYIEKETDEEYKQVLLKELLCENFIEKLERDINMLVSIDDKVKSLGFSQASFKELDSNDRNVLIPDTSQYYEEASRISKDMLESNDRKYVLISEYELFQIDKKANTHELNCVSCNNTKIHLRENELLRDYLTHGIDISEEAKKFNLSNWYCDVCSEFGKIHPQLLKEYYIHSAGNLDEKISILPSKTEDRMELLRELKK